MPIAQFDRRFFSGPDRFMRIGSGAIGGKAGGLLTVHRILADRFEPGDFPALDVAIPTLAVLGTDVFDAFLIRNALDPSSLGAEPDDRIAHACQRANLPAETIGDLRAVVEQVKVPLAVRSSSLLEDAMGHPFAGVYGTKMIPNASTDPDARFRQLVEAIKFVYASTFFREARRYRHSVGRRDESEKMAVILQEVVGDRYGERFYPAIAGVARSYNFYRTGRARPEEGVVTLALGLGKTVVDGESGWSYSPAYPRVPPPHGSTGELLELTQREFWAVNTGRPPAYDPIRETEYLVRAGLPEAERDGTLRFVASTYDPAADRLMIGIDRPGPRVVTFAPILSLELLPLNALVRRLVAMCEDALGAPVEIEFAVSVSADRAVRSRLGFLQARPMLVSTDPVEVTDADMTSPDCLVASVAVMGNGRIDDVVDIVYVRPPSFESRRTREVADHIAQFNDVIVDASRRYLLIGFGRWGSSDPWLGIPVVWSDISGARAIVETAVAGMNVEPSLGSHFVHNLVSFEVVYFTVPLHAPLAWPWLDAQPAAGETPLVRHVRLATPLDIRADGRTGRGVIRFGAAS